MRQTGRTVVLSLLGTTLDAALQPALTGPQWDYRPGPGSLTEAGAPGLLQGAGDAHRCLRASDVVLVNLGAAGTRPTDIGSIDPWRSVPAAVVGVVDGSDAGVLLEASRWQCDAVLAHPFEDGAAAGRVREALNRYRQRSRQRQRYERMRLLCRQMNHKRRHLREKVDLLCRHLVQANGELAGTVQDLRRAYDFQNELLGEFDQTYLLHKALRRIKEQVPESNAAVYLARSDDFAAHLSGHWFEYPSDLEAMEETLQLTLVAEVIIRHDTVLLPDGAACEDFSAARRAALAGLALLGLPIVCERQVIGVVALYRSAERPYTTADLAAVQPLLAPLGRVLEALRKLEPFFN